MEENIVKKPGRPIGYELSDETKDKIRRSRIGKSHSRETRNKISISLMRYFRKRDPISNGIEDEYKYFPKEAVEWIVDHRSEIDNAKDVVTNKRLMYLSQQEICYGDDIENFCHLSTPEFLMLLKEELRERGMFEEIAELISLV